MPWPAPCSEALPKWYTIEGAALLAIIETSAIKMPLGALTPRAPGSTEASTGILPLRSCRKGINWLPGDDTTCAWTWQFELGNI